MSRKKRIPKENERRAIIRELLQMANTGSGHRHDLGKRNLPEQSMQKTISAVGKYNQERYA